MPILRTLIDKIVVRITRSNLYESQYLRKYFKEHHGIDVGLYSGGAFDRMRIPPGTTIGRYSSIAASARLLDANHPTRALSTHPYFYEPEFGLTTKHQLHLVPPIVEDDVWMGHNSIATPECKRIGRGAIIGAGSVVMSDVPRYAVMIGAPAKLVRYRFSPEIIEAVEATEWWTLDKRELKRGLDAAPEFLSKPSVESAAAFMKALGRPYEKPRAPESNQSQGVSSLTAGPVVADPDSNRVIDLLRSEIATFSMSQMNTAFEDLALDSLGLLNLRSALEQQLGTRISDSKWGEVSRPADLLKFISPPEPSASVSPMPATVEREYVGKLDRSAPRPASATSRSATNLYWLPEAVDWSRDIGAIDGAKDPREAWRLLAAVAGKRLGFSQTNRVDGALHRHFGDVPPTNLATKPIRLAVLGSSTLTHLLPSIRVAALRRGLFITTHEGDYGQYLQELADPGSHLYAFGPSVILLAFDAVHLTRGIDAAADLDASEAALQDVASRIRQCWELARKAKIPVIQQTGLPLFPPLLGNNEHRLPGSKQRIVVRLNEILRQAADEEGVDILALDSRATADGVQVWHDPLLWHRAKQEVSPVAAPLYGDLVARVLAAQQGRSFKCLVLDLDNTLWGGVIGDDGLEGIVLGQGDATGEAFIELQNYALQQAKRGIILAVCSKNDEANALAPFAQHPEMVLKRSDIACFVANWDDKAKNIRRIANELNIGLDSIVFVDDNPFERNLVRAELPMVAVPELPEDPSLFARTIADAGYFEGIRVTDEDRERTRQYQVNAERSALLAESADLPTYLRGLGMQLVWKRFDAVGLQRIVQLINKTNQFNLTTRRYSEADVRAIMDDPDCFGLQLRLIDRYGDNGIIAIVIGKRKGDDLMIDTWLMSCRVLGRQVEEATLGLIVEAAKKLGANRIVGEYIPTAKNGMVRDHYSKLGFALVANLETGGTRWALDQKHYVPGELYIVVKSG